MHPFRAVVEARQFEAIRALLADDVTFLSPVALALSCAAPTTPMC
jgi:ketosteroid isomerase-like protein